VVAALAIGQPYPRDAAFRHSAAFSTACRQLGETLAGAHDEPAA
jgi:hypothetical protein